MRRRLAAFGSGFAEAFLRDNRVLPPVLALLALLVFAWIVAGIFVGGPGEDRQALNEANLAQSEGDPGSDALAPEVENRNVESYAAYESKDPFRELFASAEDTTAATTPETTTGETGGPETTGGGGAGGLDSDGDGLSDGRESELGFDPFNPDTDADGTLDGDEDSGGGGGGGRGGGGRGGLFDSGGDLRLP